MKLNQIRCKRKNNNGNGSERANSDVIEKTVGIVESTLLKGDNNRGFCTIWESGTSFGNGNSGNGIDADKSSSDSGSLGSRIKKRTVLEVLVIK